MPLRAMFFLIESTDYYLPERFRKKTRILKIKYFFFLLEFLKLYFRLIETVLQSWTRWTENIDTFVCNIHRGEIRVLNIFGINKCAV